MSNDFKFKVGDLVRPITASKKSRVWEVQKNISKEDNSKMVSALVGKPIVVTIIEVQCKSFAYNKTQIKYFNQEDLVLVDSTKV